MDAEKRQEAIFGAFDGVVSIVGVIVGLLLQHVGPHIIAVTGFAGGIAAAVSMGFGELEKSAVSMWRRLPIGVAMFVASLTGALVPVWPFFVFSAPVAMIVALVGCLVVATWIGYEKRQGWRGYVLTYVVFAVAAGLTLAIIGAVPGAG